MISSNHILYASLWYELDVRFDGTFIIIAGNYDKLSIDWHVYFAPMWDFNTIIVQLLLSSLLFP